MIYKSKIRRSPIRPFYLIRLPYIRILHIQLPHIQLPHFKLPHIQLPHFKLPQIRIPHIILLPQIRIPQIRHPKNGFTLIETIVTLTIMAVITTLAARTIQQAFSAKAKIQNQIDQVSQVKDTLRMIEKDINLAYHYIDLQKDLAEELNSQQKSNTPQGGQGQTPPNTGAFGSPQGTQPSTNPFFKTENRIDPTTQFIGKEEEMHFVTQNTVRLIKDSPQADFGEVSYFLESCKNRSDKKFDSGKCLFRRTSPLVDKDPTKGGSVTQLVPDVTEFRLRYFSKIQKDWRKDWNSTDRGGDLNTKGRYPEAIEVNLKIETQPKNPKVEKKRKISLQTVIPIHFPNNKEPNNNSNQQLQQPNGQVPNANAPSQGLPGN